MQYRRRHTVVLCPIESAITHMICVILKAVCLFFVAKFSNFSCFFLPIIFRSAYCGESKPFLWRKKTSFWSVEKVRKSSFIFRPPICDFFVWFPSYFVCGIREATECRSALWRSALTATLSIMVTPLQVTSSQKWLTIFGHKEVTALWKDGWQKTTHL